MAENDQDGRGSFAAVERSMSDRLLARTFALNDCRRSSKENLDVSPE